MIDTQTLTISCVEDPKKYTANCKWTGMDYVYDSVGQWFYPLCMSCLPGYTLYEEGTAGFFGYFDEKTAQCAPSRKNDEGCLFH